VFAFTFPSWAIRMRKNRTTTSSTDTRICIRVLSCIILLSILVNFASPQPRGIDSEDVTQGDGSSAAVAGVDAGVTSAIFGGDVTGSIHIAVEALLAAGPAQGIGSEYCYTC
jgi:hypothetical protein